MKNEKINQVIFALTVLIIFFIILSSTEFVSTAKSSSNTESFAYVTSINSTGLGNVSVIDTATNKVTATVSVSLGGALLGIAVSPDLKKVYVANNADGTVSVIDTATNKVTATVSVSLGGGLFGIAVSPAGKKVYVANADDGTISVIDTAKNKITATVKVGESLVMLQ